MTPADVNRNTTVWPLADLFEALRREGFQLRPDDYREVDDVLDVFQPQSHTDLQALIAPLIVSSDEEQEKFDRIFERVRQQGGIKPYTVKSKTDERKPKNIPWSWIATGLLGLLALVYVALLWPGPAFQSDIQLISPSAGPFEVGDTLVFGVDSSLRQAAGPQARWQWETPEGKLYPHANKPELRVPAERSGPLVVNLRSQRGHGLLFTTWTDSLHGIKYPICDKLPVIQLDSVRQTAASGRVRYQFTARIVYASTPIQLTQWRVDGRIVAQNQNRWESTFPVGKTPAYHDVRFETIPDTSQQLCFAEANLTVGIQARNAPTFTLAVRQTGGNLIVPKTQLDRRYYRALWALGILFVLLIGFYAWAFVRYWQKKKSESSRPLDSDNPLARFASDEPPLEIPLENREIELITRDQPFYQLIRTLRQPTESEIQRLHVARTMQATMREGGFPTLVFQPHMAETEYLFLIDRSQVRSQQVALFDYLFRTFIQENVCVERFFFHKTFDLFTNEKQMKGVTLRQLANTYRQHTLIIWSNGYPLLYPPYPVVEPAIREDLTDWESRAILTPVPFADWGSKERALQADFLLLPADLIGQLRLIQALHEKQTYQDTYLRQQTGELYSTEYVDFQEADELRDYLGEDLFQWLAALAVYPRIRWEIVVEMGRALLPPESVNFTNLLKLARVSWMYEGNFPDYTRLELLKALRPENEAKARQTLLWMLTYAEQYFPGEHFYDGEKYLLQTVNQFTLYAHDPDAFTDYQPVQQAFKKLYEKGLLSDGATLRYLENPDGNWSTLLPADQPLPERRVRKEGNQRPKRPQSGSLQNYLDNLPIEKDEPPVYEPIKREPKRTYILGTILLLLPLLIGGLLAWVWHLANQPQNQVQDLNQSVPVTIVLEPNACVTSLNTSITDDPRWTVSLNDSLYSITNLYAARSFPLTALASGTMTDSDGRTSVTGLRATIAVNDSTGGGEELSMTVPLTRDTLRLRINCPIASTVSSGTKTSSTVYIQYASRDQADAARLLQARLGAGGFNVPGIELRSTFRDSTQVRYFADQDRPQADSVAQIVKSFFKLHAVRVVKVGGDKKAPVEVWLNTGIAAQKFDCQTVPNSWIIQFDGWRWRDIKSILITNSSDNRFFFGITGTDVFGNYFINDSIAKGKQKFSANICQQNGVYLVTSTEGTDDFLIRNVTRNSCDVAVIRDLKQSLLNGPKGQNYFDHLLKIADFRRYTAPKQTKRPTINKNPYSSTAPSGNIYSQTAPTTSNKGISTKTEANVEKTQRRLALVIGNADYEEINRKLRNPVNDVADMSTALRQLGFTMDLSMNLRLSQMRSVISSFVRNANKNDIILLYYAGSGFQMNGVNYLAPIDAKFNTEEEVKTSCIALDEILNLFNQVSASTNLLILDTCRDEIFTQNNNSRNGLAVVNPPKNGLVAYAAAPGRVALDGDGRNSPYAQALLEALKIPNLSIQNVFQRVNAQVIKQTNGQQIPWVGSSLSSEFYFNKK